MDNTTSTAIRAPGRLGSPLGAPPLLGVVLVKVLLVLVAGVGVA
ncbi:MAG: hypothetical protein JWN00_18 [Actinomycetia bacterium]|jgi:hypothetical protein|nr:hypothetical protein [Actinomycetes bacterium]